MMALNTPHPDNGIFIYNGEYILLYCKGVKLQLEGNDLKEYSGSVKGKLFLTTHRMIFRADDPKHKLQSFDFPFWLITVKLGQPVFGANYIKGVVKAFDGGNWKGEANFNLTFLSGGAIDFGRAMAEAAKAVARGTPIVGTYVTPSTPFVEVLPAIFLPPSGMNFGFYLPVEIFNPYAISNVYQTDDPPPYPGVHGEERGPPGAVQAFKKKEPSEEPPPSYEDAMKEKKS